MAGKRKERREDREDREGREGKERDGEIWERRWSGRGGGPSLLRTGRERIKREKVDRDLEQRSPQNPNKFD